VCVCVAFSPPSLYMDKAHLIVFVKCRNPSHMNEFKKPCVHSQDMILKRVLQGGVESQDALSL